MDLQSVYAAAVQAAESDGAITVEERELLSQLQYDIERLTELMDTLDFNSPDYFRNLDSVKKQIIQNVIRIALEDGTITESERNILRKISQSLDSYYP